MACVNAWTAADRKSTRLNSSHLGNSYAVFCLQKRELVGPDGDIMLDCWIDRKSTRLNSTHSLHGVCPICFAVRARGREGRPEEEYRFFNDPAPTEIYSLSQHAPLPV